MNHRLSFMLAAALFATALPALAQPVHLTMCGNRPNTADKTCIVDGDTLWLHGEKIRMEGFDAPEISHAVCIDELGLAVRAQQRLQGLLNDNAFEVRRNGNRDKDRHGRLLRTITINGQDVGDILIAEGLARRWPDGEKFWC